MRRSLILRSLKVGDFICQVFFVFYDPRKCLVHRRYAINVCLSNIHHVLHSLGGNDTNRCPGSETPLFPLKYSWGMAQAPFSQSLPIPSLTSHDLGCLTLRSLLFVCFWGRILPCIPGWPETLNSPASASWVLRLQACTTMPGSNHFASVHCWCWLGSLQKAVMSSTLINLST
jgi:hypothetical protein